MSERRIILGGDDDYFRGPLTLHLEEAGYGVVLAGRTADLVRLALEESRDPAMMILDLHHPRLDVAAVLQTLASQRPKLKVPVIGVRMAAEDPSSLQSLKQIGIRTFVDRRMPFNEILYLIRQLIVPSSTERRKHPRVPSHIPVEFWLEGESHRSGYVTDISEGGMFIQTLEHAVLGHVLHVRFKLGDASRLVEASGEVVYTSPKMSRKTALLPGIGLKLRDLSPAHQDIIRTHVEGVVRRLPDLYDRSLIGIDKSSS